MCQRLRSLFFPTSDVLWILFKKHVLQFYNLSLRGIGINLPVTRLVLRRADTVDLHDDLVNLDHFVDVEVSL